VVAGNRGDAGQTTCPADFNAVSVQDIFDFLAAWSFGCP
jgi:hypothetical protein